MKQLTPKAIGSWGYEDCTMQYYLDGNMVVQECWSKGNSHSKGSFTVQVFTHNTTYYHSLPPLHGRNHAHLLNEILEEYGFRVDTVHYVEAIEKRKATLKNEFNEAKNRDAKAQQKIIDKLQRQIKHEQMKLKAIKARRQ